ncbi:MAG: transcriptional regulator, SARP family protein, partial [Dactylosporangium sp.]|nr:transcriptional regulator, SARP family protein [Dactylosporangium sp.]
AGEDATGGGSGAGDPRRRVLVVAITGTAGVGKTSLAVHWAHRVRDRFPDGQLYVNLRGFHASGAAMRPEEALRTFLDALDVPAHRVPADLTALVGLYRSLLADRRILIVLDNAREADQVRPLLPGSDSCLVLVTSRNELSGLVASEGAYPLALDLPTRPEARLLLAHRLGHARTAAEPEVVDELLTRCARLPLALAVVASRAAARPRVPLAAVAAELGAAGAGLDPFTGDDAATDVRAVFSWSYRALSPSAARLFRLLGLHPATPFGAQVAASLAGEPLARVRRSLAELVGARLVDQLGADRYGCHDLLHVYAAEMAEEHDPAADRQAARRRMLDYYVHSAAEVVRWIAPYRVPVTITAPADGVVVEAFCDREQALAWCAAQLPAILSAVETAGRCGFDGHIPQLAWAIGPYLHVRALWRNDECLQRAALHAARRLGDRAWQAQAHSDLARPYGRLGRYEEARAELRRA